MIGGDAETVALANPGDPVGLFLGLVRDHASPDRARRVPPTPASLYGQRRASFQETHRAAAKGEPPDACPFLDGVALRRNLDLSTSMAVVSTP